MRLKKLMFGVVFVLVLGVFGFLMIFGEKMEHIEDTNGPDNFTLAVITEEDVIACDMGSAGSPGTKESKLSIAGITLKRSVEYFSKQFSGVDELASSYIMAGSILEITIYDFQVESGNFQMYVIADDRIAGTIEPGQEVTFRTEVMEPAWYSIVVAGESAAFSFKTNNIDTDTHTIK